LGKFWPLLNPAIFLEAVEAVLKIEKWLKAKTKPQSRNLAFPNP